MDPAQSRQPTLTRDLLNAGYSHNELARLKRTGTVRRLRRGAYTWSTGEVDAAERHRQLIHATVPMLSPEAVVSHASAAVLHGLPVWNDDLAYVHVTRARAGGGRRRGPVHLHPAPLLDSEVVVAAGLRVTSLARTVVDVARGLPFDRAVTAGDAALRAGLGQEELSVAMVMSRRRPGMAAARRAVLFLDGGSESPGESMSRVLFAQLGLPRPKLQYEVLDDNGVLVGRADFCWEEHRTLGEFDGKVKYGRLLRPGEAVQDVVYQEKRREDALRDLGWQVVRWNWADLSAGAALAERLQRAFRRGLAA
jgi:hypothetical protein